jgi:uncharacterized protein
MVELLRNLQKTTPDIEASAVVSGDGLILASILPAGVEEDRVSAMSAALVGLGEQISGELGRGLLEQVYVRGTLGFVLLTSCGEKAVLTVLAKKDAKLGVVFHDMRRSVEQLSRIIE